VLPFAPPSPQRGEGRVRGLHVNISAVDKSDPAKLARRTLIKAGSP